jgi:PHP domain
MLKGALHIHSNYSDGEFTLAELRKIFLAKGCSFVCMTDHAEYFDEESIRRYIAECAALSDTRFRLLPGLEFRCERNMHILGYHATKLTQETNPQEVIRHIDAQGALSVIAHPRDDFFEWIESFATLPKGIETWNSKYDGRYAPRSGTFALLQRLRQRAPGMHAFYGVDLHWKKQFRGFFVALDCDSAEAGAILAALASGKYTAQKDDLRLPSSGIVPEPLLRQFDRVHARSYRMWRFLKNGKQTLDRLGIRVPESLKAQLRRIF